MPESAQAPSRVASPTRRGPDFIGIGAQRAGTSWLYACLYEHPQICMPLKEIHFFCRERNWRRGYEWYEGIFAECPSRSIVGEFSTWYLPDRRTPARIRDRYPGARLVVSLRHPADRAYSSYLNDIAAGLMDPAQPFNAALRERPEYLESGRYAGQLRRYLDLFPRDQLLVSIFDDARRDPLGEVQKIYRFVGADPEFRPLILERRIGIGRVPRFQRIERWLLDASSAVRRRRSTRPVWWMAKRLRLGDGLRSLNARRGAAQNSFDPRLRTALIREFEPEIEALETLLNRELPEWRR